MSDPGRCRVCDEPLEPGTTFCARCGTRVQTDEDDALTGMIVEEPTAAATLTPGAEPTQPVPVAPVAYGAGSGNGVPPHDDEESGPMRWIVLAIIAVIVIAIIALIAIALTRDDGGGKPPASTTTTSSPTTTSAPTTTTRPVTTTTTPQTTTQPTEPPTTAPPTTTTAPPTTTTTTPPTSSTGP